MVITFKDGSTREFEAGKSAYEIANAISPSLAKKSIFAKVNGVDYDLDTPINEDASLELVTKDMPEALHVLNHSCAHLLATAVKRLYPNACFGVGPAIEEGYYYDINTNTGSKLTDQDLPKIEEEMKKIVKEGLPFKREVCSREEALDLFKADKYKTELINDLPQDAVITSYVDGDYRDLCRGVHVRNTSVIKSFKLLSTAGAYWRGDSKNEMLSRVYGIAFFSEEELENYLHIIEERKKRDHKRIGRELELFMFSDYGPGLPFWLPKGYTLRRTLENWWIKVHEAHGYTVIDTPIMLSKELWETSGHWDHYKENMYITLVDENEFAIKPMNCPGAIQVYNNGIHSYRDLPLRYAELGYVHRHEASGALNGLFRVRGFHQDDAHTLLREDQIGDEVAAIIKVYDEIYSVFGLNYSIELSTRPEDNYIGAIETWDAAEAALKEACLATGHPFKINPGDGAFYGPKLDFKLRDSMNRIWQCGTIQLDMQLPGRFNCFYIDKDGKKVTPVMIHRACFGSLERFIGILIEHYAGAFPTWLAPVQVKVIPVNPDNNDYAYKLAQQFKDKGFKVEVDDREEKLGYKIREAQTKKIPYEVVIGRKEVETNTVNVRRYGSQDQATMGIDEFIKMVNADIASMGKK